MHEPSGSRDDRPKRDAPAPRTPRDELTADEIDGLAELQSEELERAKRAAREDHRPQRASKRQRRTEKTLDSVLARLRHLDEEVRELRESKREPLPPDPDLAEGVRVDAVILPAEDRASPEAADSPASEFSPSYEARPISESDESAPPPSRGPLRTDRSYDDVRTGAATAFDDDATPIFENEPSRSPAGALLVIAAIVVLGAVTGLLILGS